MTLANRAGRQSEWEDRDVAASALTALEGRWFTMSMRSSVGSEYQQHIVVDGGLVGMVEEDEEEASAGYLNVVSWWVILLIPSLSACAMPSDWAIKLFPLPLPRRARRILS